MCSQSNVPPSAPNNSRKPLGSCQNRVRIIVGESTPIGCELLKTALGRDRRLEIVALATNSEHVISAAAEHKPDVLLVNHDLQDGPGSGLQTVRRVARLLPSISAVMLLEDGAQNDVIEAFRSGAKGVFRRSESLHNLIRCVHAVHQGQFWVRTSDLTTIMRALVSAGSLHCVASDGKKLLTRREQQVVDLVADGLANREIAERLHLSEHTVKNYLFKIYDKLGVSTRVELTLYAMSGRAA